MDTVYLNGEFLPLADAKISVLDRGFLFGDGVYEVIPVYNSNLFLVNEHLHRLQHSLNAVDMRNPYSDAEWKEKLNKLISKNGGNRPLYLQVTRGIDTTRRHYYSDDLKPTSFIMSLHPIEFGKSRHSSGVALNSAKDERRTQCHIKSINLLTNILAYQKGKHGGAEDTLLIRDGLITECSTSNIFIIQDHVLKTPTANEQILHGITRKLILNLAEQHGIPCVECDLRLSDIYQADEVWISSSTREILPVITVDDKIIGSGKPGPIWQKMIAWYLDYANLEHK